MYPVFIRAIYVRTCQRTCKRDISLCVVYESCHEILMYVNLCEITLAVSLSW